MSLRLWRVVRAEISHSCETRSDQVSGCSAREVRIWVAGWSEARRRTSRTTGTTDSDAARHLHELSMTARTAFESQALVRRIVRHIRDDGGSRPRMTVRRLIFLHCGSQLASEGHARQRSGDDALAVRAAPGSVLRAVAGTRRIGCHVVASRCWIDYRRGPKIAGWSSAEP